MKTAKIILFIGTIINYCFGQQVGVHFTNPYNNSRTIIFSDSENIIQIRNENIYKYNLKERLNSQVSYNFDSILKICYRKIFRNNFDSAWKKRIDIAEKLERETNIYSFKSMKNENYFFCRIYTIDLDTFSSKSLNRIPIIYILKVNKNYKLLEIFCSPSRYVQDLYCVNAVPNSVISFENQSTLLLPIYHPNFIFIRNKIHYNENASICYGKFNINNGHIVLIELQKITNLFNQSADMNQFMFIDNIISFNNKICAYHSKIPIIYDVTNKKNINLDMTLQNDTSALLKAIENETYEIKYCNINDSQINMFYTINDSCYFGNYNFINRASQQIVIGIPANHKAIGFKNNIYEYAIVTKDEIFINSIKMN